MVMSGSLKTSLSSLSITVQPLAHMVVSGQRNLGGVGLLNTHLAVTRPKFCSSVIEKGENSGIKMTKQGPERMCSSVGRLFA